MKKKAACLLAMVLFVLISATAQFRKIESSISTKENYHSLYWVGDKCIDLGTVVPKLSPLVKLIDPIFTRMAAYDTAMNQLYSLPIKELNGMKCLSGTVVDNRLYACYVDKDKMLYNCELDINKATVKSKKRLCAISSRYVDRYQGFSPDSAYNYVCFRDKFSDKNDAFQVVVFDRQMNMIKKHFYSPKTVPDNVKEIGMVLTDSGKFFLTLKIYSKEKKEDIFRQMIIDWNDKGIAQSFQVTGLPNNIVHRVSWKASGNSPAFVGLLSAPDRKGFDRVAYGVVDVNQHSASQVKIVQLKEEVAANADLDQIIDTKDGGALLIYNFSSFYSSGMIVSQATKESVIKFGGGNIYVIKINAARECVWQRVVYRNHTESDDFNFTGFIADLTSQGDLCIYFHDHLVNKDFNNNIDMKDKEVSKVYLGRRMRNRGLARVLITSEGEVSKTFVYRPIRKGYHLSMNDYKRKGDSAIIYNAVHLKTGGRSRYRIGTMTFE